MIVFNTIKKAEHYVRYCNKHLDYYTEGYDWSERSTRIEGNRVVVIESGDSCGCGCDTGRYMRFFVVGRIKDKRSQALSLVLGR